MRRPVCVKANVVAGWSARCGSTPLPFALFVGRIWPGARWGPIGGALQSVVGLAVCPRLRSRSRLDTACGFALGYHVPCD